MKGKKSEILAYGDLPFLHEAKPHEAQTVDATFALVRYRGKGSTPGPEEGRKYNNWLVFNVNHVGKII